VEKTVRELVPALDGDAIALVERERMVVGLDRKQRG
jgi:hypothetical protein